jgi:TetR/AcrR family hemagglutinin/protease transcriptional regulator
VARRTPARTSARTRPRAARLPPAERRAQLLRSALAAFAAHGLGGTRHADVAAVATVSLPTVFVYFPTREALVDAVLDEVERFYEELIGRLSRGAGPAGSVMLEIGRQFAGAVATHPDHARVWLNWSTAIRGALWARYRRYQRRLIDLMSTVIARGQAEGTIDRTLPADDVALIYVGAAYVVVQLQFGHAPERTVDRFLRTLVAATVERPRATRPGVRP